MAGVALPAWPTRRCGGDARFERSALLFFALLFRCADLVFAQNRGSSFPGLGGDALGDDESRSSGAPLCAPTAVVEADEAAEAADAASGEVRGGAPPFTIHKA